jgi:hypothetical protein
MCSRLSRTDDTALLVFDIWPGMNDEDRDLADHSDGLPAFLLAMWIEPRQSMTVFEYKLSRFKTQSVLPYVFAILRGTPCPVHGSLFL